MRIQTKWNALNVVGYGFPFLWAAGSLWAAYDGRIGAGASILFASTIVVWLVWNWRELEGEAMTQTRPEIRQLAEETTKKLVLLDWQQKQVALAIESALTTLAQQCERERVEGKRCILNVDSPSYPPEPDEYWQCRCRACVKHIATQIREEDARIAEESLGDDETGCCWATARGIASAIRARQEK